MAGTATAVTTGDLIHCLDDNGSGQFIKGKNNARDLRVGHHGSMFLPAADGYTPRDGVLLGNVNAGTALKVDPQGSPNQTVIIRAGRAVINRTGQGTYLFVNEVDQTVNMPAASGANTRNDIVCAWAADQGPFPADTAHGAQFWVEQGALGGGVPATPAGMIKLAEVFRAVNDNTISAEIVDTRKSTTGLGAVRRLGPGDVISDAGLYVGELRDTNSSVDRWSGSAWIPLGNYSSKQFVGKTTRITSNYAYVAATQVYSNITFTPIANHVYRLSFAGDYSGTSSTAMGLAFRRVAGAGPIVPGSTLIGTQRTMPVPNGLTQSGSTFYVSDANEFGASQITIGITTTGLAGNTAGTINIGAQFVIEDLGL